MRKILYAITALLMCLTLCSCNSIDLEGYDVISAARDEYEKLQSAHITVTNLEKNMITQELTFKINPEKRMTYNYYGTDGNVVYYEYHDGTELYWTSDITADWNVEGLAGENYVMYTDTARHPLAKKGAFFVNPASVSEATVSVNGDTTVITYVYDTEKLNKNAQTLLSELGQLDGFLTEYTIVNGQFKKLLEKGFLTKDGVLTEVNYLVEVSEENAVPSIDMPVFD